MLPYFETEFTKHGRKPLKLDIGQLIGGSLNTTHTHKKKGGGGHHYLHWNYEYPKLENRRMGPIESPR